jgi:hypothetical protein
MAMCDRNPNCYYVLGPDGGVDIFVGQNHITCTAPTSTNTCSCVSCGHKQTPGKGRPTVTVRGVLTTTPTAYQPPRGPGLLDNTTGFDQRGPAAAGTPISPPRGGNTIK